MPADKLDKLERSEAPWTDEQVRNLASRQEMGWFHPYTCQSSPKCNLVPTNEGWYCHHEDKVIQTWAWKIDVDGGHEEQDLRDMIFGK